MHSSSKVRTFLRREDNLAGSKDCLMVKIWFKVAVRIRFKLGLWSGLGN